MSILKATDPEIFELVSKELNRQQFGIELIASENFVSEAVLEAQGSVLTNKYSEGLPGKRYYGGNQFIDGVETLAIERIKKLFNAPHANVQPHSGANANLGVYFAMLQPGDTILGMRLDQGGHLTHGSPVNISGKWFKVVAYGINTETGYIDYDDVLKQAKEHKPKMIVCGASAYPRIIDFAKFRAIADEVGALLMADVAHIAGLIVTGQHPNAFPHAHFVTTTTHKTLRGPRGGVIMCQEEFATAIDKAIFPGIQGGPLEHVIAAKAVSFLEASKPEFKEYQKKVVENAKALAKNLSDLGLAIVSGGTDNHLMLVDLRSVNLTGKKVTVLLDEVHITTNMNMIPNDPQKPLVTSGIRVGTPAVTTRGMGVPEMKVIAECISEVLHQPDNEETKEKTRAKVKQLCEKFPLYSSKLVGVR